MNQGDVVAVGLVNLRGIPLAETVSADARKSQIVTHDFQLLLDGSLCDGEHRLGGFDAIPQAIVFDVLLDAGLPAVSVGYGKVSHHLNLLTLGVSPYSKRACLAAAYAFRVAPWFMSPR